MANGGGERGKIWGGQEVGILEVVRLTSENISLILMNMFM